MDHLILHADSLYDAECAGERGGGSFVVLLFELDFSKLGAQRHKLDLPFLVLLLARLISVRAQSRNPSNFAFASPTQHAAYFLHSRFRLHARFRLGNRNLQQSAHTKH